LDGILVNRRERTKLVDQLAAKLEEYDDLIIDIAII
jgi:hypothetical protein